MAFLFISVALGALTDGVDSTASSTAPFSLIPGLHITTTQFGFAASILYVGGIFGALSFGWIADKIGRRNTFVASLAMMSVFEFASAFVINYTSLVLLRFLVGFAVGADYANGATYFNEFSRKQTRGRNYFWWFGTFAIGTVVMGLLAIVMFPLGKTEWRYLFAVTAIPSAIGAIMRLKLPESPRYLVGKSRVDDAKRSLMQAHLDPNDVGTFAVAPTLKGKSQLQMMRPYIFGITIPMFLVAYFINVPLTSVGLLSPLYLGVLKIKPPTTVLFTLFAFNIPITLGAFFGSAFVDRFGRYTNLVISSVGGCVCIMAMAFLAHPSTVYVLLAFQAVGSILIWFGTPVVYSIATELYPVSIRGAGEGINITGTRLAGFFGPFIGTVLLTDFNLFTVFIFDAIMLLFMFLVVVFWSGKRIETKNEEIEDAVARIEGV